MSPKAWKASFSEFHRSYSPKTGQRFSFRSPDKPRHSTLSREGSTLSRDGSTYGVSSQSSIIETPSSESRDLDTGSSHSEITGSSAEEDSSQVEKEKGTQEEESEPPAESDNKGDGEKAPSESSSELNISCDSVSLDLQLSAADGPLHIEERDDSPVGLNTSKPNGLENGEVSGVKDLSISHKVCHLDSPQLIQLIICSVNIKVLRSLCPHPGCSCRKIS